MGGEITAAIKGGLRKSAKEVLEHTDDVNPCYRDYGMFRKIKQSTLILMSFNIKNFKVFYL
ncbi:MAG: hypothetical protein CMP76_05095 [Flavobacterium sp.]|uniref:hypothetical protein n=1 Tax=Flavobacterium sp. TaxID=239 RepID=UPI000C403AA6|nr:hypothetical protein [Flavobacterium sp.]MBF02652.1 hypothetical protein [Flavobacterium sp.]